MPSSGTLRRRYRTLRSSACSANVAFAHERSGQRNRRTAKMISTGRQQRNRTLSLPLALRQLEAAGNLGNLRLAIVGKREGYRGPVFMDSDIYKTLEAVGWESSAGAVIRNWPPSTRKRRHCWRRLSSRMGT